MSLLRRLFAVRSVDSIVSELNAAPPLKRVLTARSLTAIGLGATIGTGIFILTGTVAANHAGPALTLALLIAAIGSALAAICYAEFASMIPVSGSAYTYSYATLGEAIAWFIGWNLSLEYMLSASAVAVGWSAYVVNLLGKIGIHLPDALINAPLGKTESGALGMTGAIVNLPAVLVVLALGYVCYVGVKESATLNNAMVFIKVGVIVVFILAGISYIDTANWHPYLPENTGKRGEFGWSGVFQGAAIIFFSYIGFDTASTTAREARNPQRDVPLGILGALGISAVLYVAMSAVLTGMVPYTSLDVAAPVAVALDAHPQLSWLGVLVELGAIVGMTSVILISLLGQPRIFLAMADDGLLPPSWKKVHPVHRTPHIATAVAVIVAAIIAGLLPLDVLGELISIGILLAFTCVCIGVLVLRRTKPDMPRPFRVPFAPVTCILGALVCISMMVFLPPDTWWRLLVWSVLGFSIYALYGYRHSRLRAEGK
ncbi:MAG TPA: amino acid permease [Povalibacter sp.]|uniref:amino acid permease n=1 Tax=Povalibacter sp. TaxID=1962978 RepID=UPI002BDA32E4|nr:amino acid permease [Povalibacter sp.]HMN46053.1 amino acid permease [Povalibacter sp.]